MFYQRQNYNNIDSKYFMWIKFITALKNCKSGESKLVFFKLVIKWSITTCISTLFVDKIPSKTQIKSNTRINSYCLSNCSLIAFENVRRNVNYKLFFIIFETSLLDNQLV